MTKALIFDMDGVLVDTEALHKKAWMDFFFKHDVPVTDTDITKMRGVRAVEIIKKFMPGKSDDEVYALRSERVQMQVEALEVGVTPVNGVLDFIHAAKDAGLKIGVATSAVPDTTNIVIAAIGVDALADAVVTADDVTRGKPDPEIYLTTAKRLGVPPEECIVFEDAPAGIAGALAAGMKVCALLTSHGREEFKGVKDFLNDFTEMDLNKVLGK